MTRPANEHSVMMMKMPGALSSRDLTSHRKHVSKINLVSMLLFYLLNDSRDGLLQAFGRRESLNHLLIDSVRRKPNKHVTDDESPKRVTRRRVRVKTCKIKL